MAFFRPPRPPFSGDASSFTISAPRVPSSLPGAPRALAGNVRAAGFFLARVEEVDDVAQRSLVAVMPVGALARGGLEVFLLKGAIGCLVLQPLANAISAALEKRDLVSHTTHQ